MKKTSVSLIPSPDAAMPFRAVLGLCIAVLVLSNSAACSERADQTTRPATSPSAAQGSRITPGEALARAEASLRDGYTIAVTAANFVLPGWGGSDSGTVQVGPGGTNARAKLLRTGEDSAYAIVLVDGQTYFRRGTCETWARMPGGRPDVLAPFLLNRTSVLSSAKAPRFISTGKYLVVEATIDGLGHALVQLDPATYRLTSIIFGDKPDNAGNLGFTFDFSEFGTALVVEKPAGAVPERFPGGGVC